MTVFKGRLLLLLLYMLFLPRGKVRLQTSCSKKLYCATNPATRQVTHLSLFHHVYDMMSAWVWQDWVPAECAVDQGASGHCQCLSQTRRSSRWVTTPPLLTIPFEIMLVIERQGMHVNV